MARAAAALTVLLFSAGQASAQDTLTVGQPIDRAITAGATHEYRIAVDAGDYVAGAVDQRGSLGARGRLHSGRITPSKSRRAS